MCEVFAVALRNWLISRNLRGWLGRAGTGPCGHEPGWDRLFAEWLRRRDSCGNLPRSWTRSAAMTCRTCGFVASCH